MVIDSIPIDCSVDYFNLSPFLLQGSLPLPYTAVQIGKPVAVVIPVGSAAEAHVMNAMLLARSDMNAADCDTCLASLHGKANTQIHRFAASLAVLRTSGECTDAVLPVRLVEENSLAAESSSSSDEDSDDTFTSNFDDNYTAASGYFI